MSQILLDSFKDELDDLAANRGVNPTAKFQTSERQKRFPGNNLHFTYSLINIRNQRGIGQIDTERHRDVYVSVDSNGNFTTPDYVTESRKFCDLMKAQLREAENNGDILISFDTQSFLNRRLATF